MIQLNQAIVAPTVLPTSNFQLINAGRDGKFGTIDDVHLTISEARYNAQHHTITLVIGPRALIHGTTVLFVKPSGVVNRVGQELAGDGTGRAGTNFLAFIGL